MKKFLTVLLCVAMLASAALGLAACGTKNPDDISDSCTANADGEWVVAMIANSGTLADKSYNQYTWNGVKLFAYAKKLSYRYYTPVNVNKDGYLESIRFAAENGAQVIVCPGAKLEAAVFEAQTLYPNVKFILIDGQPHDDEGVSGIENNVHCVLFQDEQAGYLAGYAIVMDGYTKLGFFGGDPVSSVIRFGYGFVQGADAAAKKLGVSIEIKYGYSGGAGSSPITSTMYNWYDAGTEVVFTCGGIQSSVLSAAKNIGRGTKVIGADVNQAHLGEAFVTSAVKQLAQAVQIALENWKKGEWDTMGGKTVRLGAADNCIGLPTDIASWRFFEFKVSEYNKIFKSIKNGTLVVNPNASEEVKPTVSANTTVDYDA